MANELWAEVYNADGVRLGIVTLITAAITKQMDMSGMINLSVPTTDPNAFELLQVWRSIKLYWNNPRRGKTHIGSGVLLSPNLSDQGGQTTWAGQDIFQELQRINTWRGLTYSDESISDVVNDLVGRVSGWTAKIESGLGNTSRRFDNQSILSAILTVVQGAGVHLRPGQIDNRIDVGAFGDDSGLYLSNLGEAVREVGSNSNLVIIQSLTLVKDGFDLKNVVEPVWGQGDAVLTLKRSTRTSPYPITTRVKPNGQLMYLLEDTASVAQYGEVQGILSMPDMPYIENDGGTSIINGANILYDWAATKLARISQPKETYQVNGIKLDKPLRPGDKIRLVYKGLVYHEGKAVRWVDVNNMFWVLSMSENYGVNGQTISFQISNVDEPVASAEQMMVDLAIDANRSAVRPQFSSTNGTYSDTLTVSATNSATMSFTIGDTVRMLGDCLLTLTKETVSPDTVSVDIDGISVDGGPWLVGDTLTETIDVEDALFEAGITGDHLLRLTCLHRGGDVDVKLSTTEIGVTQ